MMNLSPGKNQFLANLAYEQDMGLITEQLSILFKITTSAIAYIYVEKTDTEGFICKVEDQAIMFFSGTESVKDLKYDLIFIPTKYHDGYIHLGFKNIIDLICDPICEAVEDLFRGEPLRKIQAGGHSLGASISMGACDDIYLNGYSHVPTTIATFGCPNGWSKGARESFNKRHQDTTNYINPGDYVTWLLGITTGRPGRDIKLSGKWGHAMDKYQKNISNENNK